MATNGALQNGVDLIRSKLTMKKIKQYKNIFASSVDSGLLIMVCPVGQTL